MTASARETLALYRRAGLSSRLHLRVRWATCPFAIVADAVPMNGRVLEIGCGHGLFSSFLALSSTHRDVHGTDLDPDKIHVARLAAEAASAQGARLAFDVSSSGEVLPGPWEAVVIIDVLYLLSGPAQLDLIARSAAQLAPGGALIVKEMGDRPRWKARWNEVQEVLSVHILNITEGGRMTFLPPSDLIGAMSGAGLHVTAEAVDRGRPHPHLLLVGRRV